MSLHLVPTGKNPPEDLNVIIEIPMNSEPVKYEVDKDSGALFVDRLVSTLMRYPCNYGYVPHTLGGDGDPLDVLVITPFALMPGSVINCRPIGMLAMSDEGGEDEKLVAVPNRKISPIYNGIDSVRELPELTREQIAHFFAHYKDLEKGKWVKIEGWHGPKDARKVIEASIQRYNDAPKKPRF